MQISDYIQMPGLYILDIQDWNLVIIVAGDVPAV